MLGLMRAALQCKRSVKETASENTLRRSQRMLREGNARVTRDQKLRRYRLVPEYLLYP